MNVKFKTNIVLRIVALGHLLKIECKAITKMIKNDLIRDGINKPTALSKHSRIKDKIMENETIIDPIPI